MSYCEICELNLPSEEKLRIHSELLHEEEISEVPFVTGKSTQDVEKILRQLGVTVSDNFPSNPAIGQIHYNTKFASFVWDGKAWIPVGGTPLPEELPPLKLDITTTGGTGSGVHIHSPLTTTIGSGSMTTGIAPNTYVVTNSTAGYTK